MTTRRKINDMKKEQLLKLYEDYLHNNPQNTYIKFDEINETSMVCHWKYRMDEF